MIDASDEFLYGLSIVILGVFLQWLFLQSILILIGATMIAIGTVFVIRGFLHIRKRNKFVKTWIKTNVEDLR